MAEYIDRDWLLREYDRQHKGAPGRARKIMETAPAADVKPVVRCRDCDHWNDWDHAGRESLGSFRCSCAYWSVEDGVTFYTAPTDFCSHGEKRMDGDEDDKAENP